jgi:hypothetical protein
MQIQSPIYFENQGSVVRGRIDRRHRNHVMTVVGEYYLRPDGTEVPIYLGFARKLPQELVFAEVPVALLDEMKKQKRKAKRKVQ